MYKRYEREKVNHSKSEYKETTLLQIILKEYYQKYITIKDEKVIYSYKTEDEAIIDMLKQGYKLGEFIVQLVAINDGSKANFVSNVYV